jgi:hypothetical protein
MALHTKGMQVPEQIPVVGYDDLPESRHYLAKEPRKYLDRWQKSSMTSSG